MVNIKIKNKPNKDTLFGFAAILPTGYSYNLHFNLGIDFTHHMIIPSFYANLNDPTIILRYNYTT